MTRKYRRLATDELEAMRRERFAGVSVPALVEKYEVSPSVVQHRAPLVQMLRARIAELEAQLEAAGVA